MEIAKSLRWALVVTIVSCILLTIAKGVPTTEQLLMNGAQMFIVAFLALLLNSIFNKK